MAMSDAYWNATRPNGMPDYAWQALQAAKKAEEEAKKAEEASKKANNSYTTAKNSVANTNPTSYNTAQYYAAQAIKNAGQSVPSPKTPDVQKYSTATAIANSTPSTSYNTAELEAAKAVNAARDKLNAATTSASGTVEDKKNTSSSSTTHSSGSARIPSGSSTSTAGNKNTVQPITPVKREDKVISNPNPRVEIPQVYGDTSGGSNGSSSGSDYYSGASYKPYPTAEEMAQYVSTVIQAAKEELGGVKEPVYLTKHMGSDTPIAKPGAPELRTLDELAKAFGIEYNYQAIYDKFNDSVEKQYDAIYQRQKQNEDKYYDNAAAAQNTLLDTLSRDRSNAVSAGVSKGMQAANALGAMLGVSQQFANNATALSQERSNTAKDYGAALAKAVVDAEATSNERKNAIMEIAKMLYGYDSEQYVANMDNYNTILTNNAALQQSYMSNHTALQNALASIFGGVVNNKITGDANVQSSLLASEAQKAAQEYAAQQSLLGSQYVADTNKWIAQLQAGLLGNNEVPKADGTDTTSDGSSFNPLLWTDSLKTMLSTGLIQNALDNVKDATGSLLAGLPSILYK